MEENFFYRYSHPGAYGHSDKSKSASIKMDDFKDGANQTGPDDAVYANVKKSNAANDANGAIDNANFVADSDGTYDPVDNKQQPKKVKDFEYSSGLDGYIVYDYSSLLSVSAQSSPLDERLDSFSVISRV